MGKASDNRKTKPTPLLANMEALFREYRTTNPGTPHWYRLTDYIVGVLLEREIARIAALQGKEINRG